MCRNTIRGWDKYFERQGSKYWRRNRYSRLQADIKVDKDKDYKNIARFANAAQCHSWLSGISDCHKFTSHGHALCDGHWSGCVLVTLIKCFRGHKSLGLLFEGVLYMNLSLSLNFFGRVMSPHHSNVSKVPSLKGRYCRCFFFLFHFHLICALYSDY